MEKLKNKNVEEVIEYFDFNNMLVNEPDFCPLYEKKQKCHDMEDLNCYLCACPNFRFDDNGFREEKGKTLFSFCSIDSRDGAQFVGENYIHQNCAGCLVPHKKEYIKKHFDRNWKTIMKDVQPK